MKINVKSTIIDWLEKTLEITDATGKKDTIPLDLLITVTMIGYPDRQTRTMPARGLGDYMSQGYIIEQIEYEGEA